MNKIKEIDYFLLKDKEFNILYHIPTGNLIKVSEQIFNELNDNKELKSEETLELISFLDAQDCITIRKYNEEKFAIRKRLQGLVFSAAETCNLKCRYCFADGGTYGNNTHKIMNINDYEKYIGILLDKYPEGIESINFFGGEPLLGFNSIKECLLYVLDICKEKNLTLPKFSIITNGTLLTEDMIDFFNKYNVNITLSLDGPKHINDKARISKDGTSVYDKVTENLKLMKKRKFKLVLEATITKYHMLAYKKGFVRELIDEFNDFDAILLAPVFTDVPDLTLSEDQKETIKMFYGELVDCWFEKVTSGEKAFYISEIIGILNTIIFKRYFNDCGAGECIYIAASGEIYPCQAFYGSKTYKLGQLSDNLNFDNFVKLSNEINKTNRLQVEACKKCPVRYSCGAWCRGTNNTVNGSILSIIESRCWCQNAILEAVLKNLVRVQSNQEISSKFIQNFNRLIEENKIQ
ncbi:MAG: radical SAM protein [Lutisporaceae bacterium]